MYGTAVDVCDRLVNEAELTGPRGRTLYTNNYYTSVKLAKHLFEKYRWTMVGTIVPTDKKTREDHDIPFLKLSNGAHNGLERGWFWPYSKPTLAFFYYHPLPFCQSPPT